MAIAWTARKADTSLALGSGQIICSLQPGRRNSPSTMNRGKIRAHVDGWPFAPRATEHLYPARGLQQARASGDALVDGQGLDRPALAHPKGIFRACALSAHSHRYELQDSGDDRLS